MKDTVSSPRTYDKAYGAQNVYKLAKEKNTEVAYINGIFPHSQGWLLESSDWSSYNSSRKLHVCSNCDL